MFELLKKELREYELEHLKLPDFPRNIFQWIKTVCKIIEGHKRTNYLPMWDEIYANQSHRKMIVAARQTGKSTYISTKMAFEATTQKGVVIVYVTFDENNLTHYSDQKFRRGMLGWNLILKKFIKGSGLGQRREVSFQNGSAIFLVTDEGEYKHIEGKSPWYAALDESQHQDVQFLPVLTESLAMTKGKLDILGRGGEAGSAYERMWKQTDQRKFIPKDLNWRDKLRFGPNGLIEGEYLREVCAGEWIAMAPQNNTPGYWLPQEIFPQIPLTTDDAIHKYKTAPEFSIEWKRRNYPKSMFLAHVTAQFYKATRRPITEEMVLACMRPYREYHLLSAEQVLELKQHYRRRATVLMGTDWGSGSAGASSTVISIILKIRTGVTDDTARYILAYIHKIERGVVGEPEQGLEEAEFVINLFKKYGCDYGVADLGYGERQVEAIQYGSMNPRTGVRFSGIGLSKFIGCRTIQDVTSPEQNRIGKTDAEVDEAYRLQVDKTHMIDDFVDFIGSFVSNPADPNNESVKRPKLMIPFADEFAVEWLIKDFTNITRKDLEKTNEVAIEDPRQVPKKEYNHPPDSVMSIIYALLADNNFRPGGADFAGTFTSLRRK